MSTADGSLLESSQLVLGGRYRIERMLGHGGMGTVYLVKHVQLDEWRALKVVRPDVIDEPGVRLRFRREARAHSRVRHPNVATLYDFEETVGGDVWMILEYIEGEALDDVVRREGRLSPERVAAILQQLCSGVAAAHDAGLVHRDLKPGNLLLSVGRGGLPLVKVIDFGIARSVSLGEHSHHSRLTSTNFLVGTPAYLSPDQLIEMPETPIDARSDVYTIGVIAMELLTGQLPTKSGSLAEIVQRTYQPLPLLAELAPDTPWPAALEAAIRRATAIEREERTATALEFAAEVCEAIVDSGLGSAERIFPFLTPRGGRTVQAKAAPIDPLVTEESAIIAHDQRGVVRGWTIALAAAALAGVLAVGLTTLSSPTPQTPVSVKADTAGRLAVGSLNVSSDTSATNGTHARQTTLVSKTPELPGEGPIPRSLTPSNADSGLIAAASTSDARARITRFLHEFDLATATEADLQRRAIDASALMRQSASREDSVALEFAILETNVMLDQVDEACGRARRIIPRSQGTSFIRATQAIADTLRCPL